MNKCNLNFKNVVIIKQVTFEIDDDYADDYDFGLYQGDRSKARKHADNLIYKLCENQEYSIDEKEHMINMLVRDIERYILTTQLKFGSIR